MGTASSTTPFAQLVPSTIGFTPPPGSYFSFSVDRHPYLLDAVAAKSKLVDKVYVGYVSEDLWYKILVSKPRCPTGFWYPIAQQLIHLLEVHLLHPFRPPDLVEQHIEKNPCVLLGENGQYVIFFFP